MKAHHPDAAVHKNPMCGHVFVPAQAVRAECAKNEAEERGRRAANENASMPSRNGGGATEPHNNAKRYKRCVTAKQPTTKGRYGRGMPSDKRRPAHNTMPPWRRLLYERQPPQWASGQNTGNAPATKHAGMRRATRAAPPTQRKETCRANRANRRSGRFLVSPNPRVGWASRQQRHRWMPQITSHVDQTHVCSATK